MSLMKRGAVWWAYFYVEGVRHQRSTGTGTRRLAEQIAQKYREDALREARGLPQADPDLTFGALAARFIAAQGRETHHVGRLRQLLPHFADVRLARITKPAVREYRQERHRRKRMSDATINRDVSVLRHLLYWAVDEGLLEANPLARLRLPAERRSPKPVLTVGEEARLLAAASPHQRELIVLALDTGMRRGELFAQRWEHVDLARGVLQVTRSKTAQGEGREIPLAARPLALLSARRQAAGLVVTYAGRALGSVKTGWRGAIRRAGLRHVRFHDLRHAFNTRLLEAGVLPDVRKALMGHTAGGGVHALYTHVELPLKRRAIAALDAWRLAQTPTTDDATTRQEDRHDRRDEDAREGRERPQGLEEAHPGGGGAGRGGQAEGGDRAGGGGAGRQEAAAPEVRRGPQDL
jgi:integrase